jgi:hypothetical protein
MFNCEHCQKKYKRSWHQARHSQMKHENSNASTATTSSASTPPTPEINGNIPSNNNYNYQQLQQVPQMPSQPLAQDMNHISPMQPQHQLNVATPPVANNWDQMVQHPMQQALPIQQHTVSLNQQLLSPQQANQQLLSPQQANQQLLSPHQANQQLLSPHQANQQLLSPQQANQQLLSPQHQVNHHHHAMYPATEMTDSTKNYNASQSVPQQNTMQTSEYINYAVNEQYSSKFDQVQSPPLVNTGMNSSPYDSWVSFLTFPKSGKVNLMNSINFRIHQLLLHHGNTTSNITLSPCITIKHKHNQTIGPTTIRTNIRRTECTITLTIIIRPTTIALINHPHQFTSRMQIHPSTTTAEATIILRIHLPIPTTPTLHIK